MGSGRSLYACPKTKRSLGDSGALKRGLAVVSAGGCAWWDQLPNRSGGRLGLGDRSSD